MLGKRLQRWPNIEPTLCERYVFAGYPRDTFSMFSAWLCINPSTAGAAYIQVFIFY